MATMPSNDETRKAICEIVKTLGFDPGGTRSIDIHMGVGDLVTVKAEVFVEIGQMRELVTTLRRYKIVPLEKCIPPGDPA